MTTALQRLLNVLFVLLSPIPVIAASWSYIEGGAAYYIPLGLLFGSIPLAVIAILNFVTYKKLTLWHSAHSSHASSRKELLIAMIPFGITAIYALSVVVFYIIDTRPLYLSCEITDAPTREHIGKSMKIGILHLPRHNRADEYFAFEAQGWLSDTPMDLGIAWWDFQSQSWESPVGPDSVGGLDSFRSGGLVVKDDRLISRGWLYTGEPYDRLTISRQSGEIVMSEGARGLCKESVAPPVSKEASGVDMKF